MHLKRFELHSISFVKYSTKNSIICLKIASNDVSRALCSTNNQKLSNCEKKHTKKHMYPCFKWKSIPGATHFVKLTIRKNPISNFTQKHNYSITWLVLIYFQSNLTVYVFLVQFVFFFSIIFTLSENSSTKNFQYFSEQSCQIPFIVILQISK